MGVMNRSLYPLRVLQQEAIDIGGSFSTNGSSAVDASLNEGIGWTVARTGTGLFTVTLTQKPTALIYKWANLSLGTPADGYAQACTYTAPTATSKATLVISVVVAGALADVAAATHNRISFCIRVRNTHVKPVRGA